MRCRSPTHAPPRGVGATGAGTLPRSYGRDRPHVVAAAADAVGQRRVLHVVAGAGRVQEHPVAGVHPDVVHAVRVSAVAEEHQVARLEQVRAIRGDEVARPDTATGSCAAGRCRSRRRRTGTAPSSRTRSGSCRPTRTGRRRSAWRRRARRGATARASRRRRCAERVRGLRSRVAACAGELGRDACLPGLLVLDQALHVGVQRSDDTTVCSRDRRLDGLLLGRGLGAQGDLLGLAVLERRLRLSDPVAVVRPPARRDRRPDR